MGSITLASRTDMQRSFRYLLAATALFIALPSLLSHAASPATKPASVQNPHWNIDRCNACHDMSSGAPTPIDPQKIDKLCLSCHDGKQAVAEVHPIRRKFKPADGVVLPSGFPTFNEQLGCNTCHDARFACEVQANVQSGNLLFLRDVGEGNGTELSWCQKCHQAQSYAKINPHEMLNKDGLIIEKKCLICHNKVPDRTAIERTSKPDLKAAQAMICRDCHSRHQDPITQMHVGLQMTPRQQAFMCAKEKLGLSSNPSNAQVDALVADSKKPTLMVTGAEGQMLCSTCHNVHEKGLFAPSSALDYLSMQFDSKGKLVSPVRDASFCRHCHSMW